jgi:arsenite methyltransferase
VLLSSRRVGPTGKGLRARHDRGDAGAGPRQRRQGRRVERRLPQGRIEAIPLPAGTVDVVISNCVVNLSTDKPAVFAETFRVLKPGGRLGITDVVAEDRLSSEDRAERGAWVGCVAGALSRGEYQARLAAAGFREVSVTFTHPVGDGLHSAIIKATKPVHATPAAATATRRELPVVQPSGC